MSNLDLRAAQETDVFEQMVKNLLLGAEVLDQKKADTKRLVNGLIGLLRMNPAKDQYFRRVDRWFDSERFGWNVREECPGNIRVAGYVGAVDGGSAGVFRPLDLVYDSNLTGDLPLRHIEVVHANLALLVHGLLVTYPHLIDLIQPILAAAQNAKR